MKYFMLWEIGNLFELLVKCSDKMSFLNYKRYVECGDTIVAFLGHNKSQPVQISRNGTLNTKFGSFDHRLLIGKKFGTKVYSRNKKGWMYILHPTPELWTTTLPHRTQILYSTDISMVLLQLNLKPGSIVIESGTGSGSMSHAIMRTIAPSGHLYTFEFHEQRAQTARSEFVDHGLADLVTVNHRNVLTDGFALDHVADAVFLDLPAPWEAIETSKDALKVTGGHLCSFSPCIEQVQSTCAELCRHGFKDIRTMECLLRTHNVKTTAFFEPNFGTLEDDDNYEEPTRKRSRENEEGNRTNNYEVDNDKDYGKGNDVDTRENITKDDHDDHQTDDHNKYKDKDMDDTGENTMKDNHENQLNDKDNNGNKENDVDDNGENTIMKDDQGNQPNDHDKDNDNNGNEDDENGENTMMMDDHKTDHDVQSHKETKEKMSSGTKRRRGCHTTESKTERIEVVTSKAYKQLPGHTGYLTFAVLY